MPNIPTYLPLMVFLVQECPRNKTDWLKASKRLNCSIDTPDNTNLYHCVPSQDRSSLLEFCFNPKRIGVQEGNCIALTSSGILNPINCDDFKFGCPTTFYFSSKVYKYPACLEVDIHQRCFLSQKNCLATSQNTTNNIHSTITVSTEVPDIGKGGVEIGKILLIVITSGFFVLILAALICYLYRRKTVSSEVQSRENGDTNPETVSLLSHSQRESTKKQGERDMEEKEIQEKSCGKDEKEIQAEVDVKEETDMEGALDDLHCSNDFRNVCSYDCLQKDIVQVYRSMQILVGLPAFDRHIGQDSHKMHDINRNLEMRKHDLMKTDCSIVVAGETSSGKSSIINLIIGEDIVPTGIMATTTRVCRIKYSDKMRVSALDKEGKELVRAEFNDEEELTEKIEELATTADEEIEYIDVWFPVPILKGNIIIVDTPGKGDTEQDDVAKKMMEYLPNALAFIFVVNVASAGGFQDDRLLHIIKCVRESMLQMYCFDPEDAIFLLNKWDAVVEKKKKGGKDTYEEFKDKVHTIWEDVKDSNILKFASAKVHEEMAYKNEFAKFQEILKDVITKNEFKRVKVHLGFIKSFLDDCDVSLSNKLRCARQSTDEAIKELDQLDTDLQVIRNKREEAYSSLQESVDQFLEETTEDLYQYIHSTGFKSIVLQGTEKCMRVMIKQELETRIEKATLSWQQENIGMLFERKILQNLTDNFVEIHESLHKIKNKMKGFTSPFDVKDKLGPVLLSLIAPSGTAVAGSMAMIYMSVSPRAASAVVAAGVLSGLVITGLVALDVLRDVVTVTENTYKTRIDKRTKEKIREMLHKTYEEKFKTVVKSYLEGDLKIEIDDLSKSVESTRSKVDSYKKDESSLHSLSSEISKIRKLVEKFENIEMKLD